jgi:hypothetical protein
MLLFFPPRFWRSSNQYVDTVLSEKNSDTNIFFIYSYSRERNNYTSWRSISATAVCKAVDVNSECAT